MPGFEDEGAPIGGIGEGQYDSTRPVTMGEFATFIDRFHVSNKMQADLLQEGLQSASDGLVKALGEVVEPINQREQVMMAAIEQLGKVTDRQQEIIQILAKDLTDLRNLVYRLAGIGR